MGLDDDFSDLFGEIEVLQGSSQESLTNADDDDDQMLDDFWTEDVLLSDSHGEVGVPPLHQTLESNGQSHYNSLSLPSSNLGPRSIGHIEHVINRIVGQILNDDLEIKIALKSRRRKRNDTRGSVSKDICFPGKTEKEAWRFAVVLRILELMHEALHNNVVISKRDIFYRDPALFNSQSYVDRYVDDIAFTFNLQRAALNVTAAAKGLVAGHVIFNRRDGTLIDASLEREGQLVPAVNDVLSIDMGAVKWILVVEKEASFRSILSSDFGEVIMTDGIIITGKGYPDVATRALLHALSHPTPFNGFALPPVLGLADFDPDGIAILSTYKQGSRAMAHENVSLVTPALRWLGLRSQHISLATDDVHASQGLLHLTGRDRLKARKMLEERHLMDGEASCDLRVMLMLNIKAELQLLEASKGSMSRLLRLALPQQTSGD